jgi:EmrB/QacA subfamily drug resistance transporter
MVDYFTWPWEFAMPAGLALASFALSLVVVGNSKEDHAGRFDIGGSVLSALAIGGLVLGIHEGPEKGWTDPLTVAGLVVGTFALVAFVLWELRRDHPLFDVRLFRNRSLSTGALNLTILFAVMFGLFLVLVQFLQAVLGYSALQASVGLLPMALVMMPLSAISPSIAARIGTRPTLLLGTALFGTGLAVLASMASVEGGYWSIVPGLLILASGMGLAMTPSTTAITETLPTEKQGVASALNDTVRELGGAFGVALLGSVLNSSYRASVASTVEALPAPLRAPVEAGIGSALSASAQAGDQAPVVVDAARQAFVEGWRTSMWVGVALAAIAFLYVLVRGPRGVETTETVADLDVSLEPVLAAVD